MTYPGPSVNRRRLPYHSDRDMLELEARRGIYANALPSAGGDPIDGLTGGMLTAEQKMRGWTSQQPFEHVDCPVMHLCIMCAKVVDPDFLRDHICKVAAELAHQ